MFKKYLRLIKGDNFNDNARINQLIDHNQDLDSIKDKEVIAQMKSDAKAMEQMYKQGMKLGLYPDSDISSKQLCRFCNTWVKIDEGIFNHIAEKHQYNLLLFIIEYLFSENNKDKIIQHFYKMENEIDK